MRTCQIEFTDGYAKNIDVSNEISNESYTFDGPINNIFFVLGMTPKDS